MLKRKFPLVVKPIYGFIYSDEINYNKTKEILIKKLGKIDFESEKIEFNYTSYYNQEMGLPLWRKFISFEKLILPDKFVDLKLFALKLENKFANKENRTVNIDPGYINDAKLVLTTTKDFAHRIYLNKGIFAEVTLVYRNNQFTDLPTTFPDYRTEEYKKIFQQIKTIYHKQIKEG